MSLLKNKLPSQIIMFHEINQSIIDWLDYNSDLFYDKIFTFDDGLYSQYYYFETIDNLFPIVPKFYFISTDIICGETQNQSHTFPRCDLAHKYYFNDNSNKKHYMKLSQIRELSNYSNVYIGGHGHKHLSGKIKGNLSRYSKEWLNDFDLMVQWFKSVNIPLREYCTPYNEYNILLHGLVKRKYDIEIIGPERIDIYDLIEGKK